MTPVEMFAIEEVSTCAAQTSRRLFKDANFGAERLLRLRLDEEADRYVVPEWMAYKRELRRIEALLRNAGIPDDVVKWASDDLDVAAVDLYTTGRSRLLEVGLDVGQKLATGQSFVITMPPMRSIGCKSLGESEPALMLVYMPDVS
jgi:hypothetical protein